MTHLTNHTEHLQMSITISSIPGRHLLCQSDFSRSTEPILDTGGLIWESDQRFATV